MRAPSRARASLRSAAVSRSKRRRFGGQRRDVALGLADHAGPAQHVERIDGARRAAGHPVHLGRAREQCSTSGSVEFERGDRGRRAAQVDARVDLAAAKQAAEDLARVAFESAQIFGQAQRQLEVAVIDGAQLAGERAPRALALAPREAGHAADHGGVPGLRRRTRHLRGLRGCYKRAGVYMRTGVPERPLQIEHADLSLLGHREENQDRVAIAVGDDAVFLAVVDGMGGHADGARAAEVAIRTMLERSGRRAGRCSIPTASCTSRSAARTRRSWSSAAACRWRSGRAPPARSAWCRARAPTGPTSATAASISCAAAGSLERTRDHSHVELLLREGASPSGRRRTTRCATSSNAASAAIRRCPKCAQRPARAAAGRRAAAVLGRPVGGLDDEQIAALGQDAGRGLRDSLADLGARAVRQTRPTATTPTAAAVRWLGP